MRLELEMVKLLMILSAGGNELKRAAKVTVQLGSRNKAEGRPGANRLVQANAQ